VFFGPLWITAQPNAPTKHRASPQQERAAGSAPRRGDTGHVRVPHSFSKNYSPSLTCSFLGQSGHNIKGEEKLLKSKKRGKKKENKKLVAIEFVLERVSITIANLRK